MRRIEHGHSDEIDHGSRSAETPDVDERADELTDERDISQADDPPTNPVDNTGSKR